MPPKPKGKKAVASAVEEVFPMVNLPPTFERELTNAPIYFISTHGQYNKVSEELYFQCPPNTYIFETAGVQHITSIDIDPLLWYLMQGQNRTLFFDIFTNKSDEEILAAHGEKIHGMYNELLSAGMTEVEKHRLKDQFVHESINAFRHVFKHITFYGPGQVVPIRKLTLHNIKRKVDWSSFIMDGKFVQTHGRLSTRMMYLSMGFWNFYPDSPYYTFPRVPLDYEYVSTIVENNDENDDENYEMNDNMDYNNTSNIDEEEENNGDAEKETEEDEGENILQHLQQNRRRNLLNIEATSCDKTYLENFTFKSEKPREPQGCARMLPDLYDILNRTNIRNTGKEAEDPDAPFITNQNIIFQEPTFVEYIEKLSNMITTKEFALNTLKEHFAQLQASKRTKPHQIQTAENDIAREEREIKAIHEEIAYFVSKQHAGMIPELNPREPNIFIFSSCAEAHGDAQFLNVIKNIQETAIKNMDRYHFINPSTPLGTSNLYIDTMEIKDYEPGQELSFLEKDKQTQDAIQAALVYIENPAEVLQTHIPYEIWKYRYTYMQDKATKLGGAKTRKQRKHIDTKRRRASTRIQKKRQRHFRKTRR